MLNRVTIMGRMAANAEYRTTNNGINVATFTVAVDKKYKTEGTPGADFFECVAWRNTADFVNNYFHKGEMIAVDGFLQTRTHKDKNGNNRKVVEIVAENVSFCGNKKTTQFETQEAMIEDIENTEEPDKDTDDLPF